MSKKFKKITVPSSWRDITLGDYQTWCMKNPKDYSELVDYVCEVCKLEKEEILSYPTEVFTDIVKAIDFVFNPNFAPTDFMEWNGTVYKINEYEKMPLREYVDIDSVFKTEGSLCLSDVLAIVLRPENETYNPDASKERSELFRSIPCDVIMPLVAFFLSNTTNLDNALSVCSLTMDQANQYLYDLKNFVPNGDGIKPYATYQKIRLMTSTKRLKEALKKCSDSYSINKIKQEQTKTNLTLKNK